MIFFTDFREYSRHTFFCWVRWGLRRRFWESWGVLVEFRSINQQVFDNLLNLGSASKKFWHIKLTHLTSLENFLNKCTRKRQNEFSFFSILSSIFLESKPTWCLFHCDREVPQKLNPKVFSAPHEIQDFSRRKLLSKQSKV